MTEAPNSAHVVETDRSLVLPTGDGVLRSLADCLVPGSWGLSAASVTLVQMRKALVNLGGGAIYTVANTIPADIADPVNIEWTASNVVTPGDPLATAIQAALGYNDAQMTALFAAAKLL